MGQKIKAREIKKPEFCDKCPVDINTGKRMYCKDCSEKYIDYFCKGIQYAFGYIEIQVPKKKKVIEKPVVEFVQEEMDDIDMLEVLQ